MNALRDFRRRAARALADERLHVNLRRATASTLAKQAQLETEIPGYSDWRRRVAEIRREGQERREDLLAQATERLSDAGARVHLARSAAEARDLVTGIARDCGARLAVKGKSMLSEEIGLTPQLEAAGLEVLETDLGEFIVQLAGEPPSHITAPALHLNREQIGRLFQEKLGTGKTQVPEELTAIARRHLREKFLSAELGISGVNFVVAETGTLVLVENEGNIGLSTTLPRVHVALTGIEKLVPRLADIDALLRVLPPNGTGQRATSYVSLINGPAPPGCGPEELHVVFVDNGRSALAASAQAEILSCIRCGSCLNVCPVFRHVGGHAYGSVYPGPMGILLSPYLTPPAVSGGSAHADSGGNALAAEEFIAANSSGSAGEGPGGHNPGNSLADVCSLCGACAAICPAEIPLPDLILGARVEKERHAPLGRRLLWSGFAFLAGRPHLFRLAGATMRTALRALPVSLLERLSSAWSRSRCLPAAPPRSFLSELKRRHPGRIS